MRYGFAPLDVVSRILVGFIFVLSGVNKFVNWHESFAYLEPKMMVGTSIVLAIAAVIEVFGGLALWFGIKARTTALILFLYLIPVTLIFHHFWGLTGMMRQLQFVNFLKNISIMGGLLYIANNGAGRWSIDSSSYHGDYGRWNRKLDDERTLKRVS